MYSYKAEVVGVVNSNTVRLRVDLGFGHTVERDILILELEPEKGDRCWEAEDYLEKLLPEKSMVCVNTYKIPGKNKYMGAMFSIGPSGLWGVSIASFMHRAGYGKKVMQR